METDCPRSEPPGQPIFPHNGESPEEEYERLKLLARHTGNIVIFTDAERRITWVNDAFIQITGYPLEEVRGRNPRLLQGPETDPQTVARIRAAIHTQKRITAEILNYTRNQIPYWVELEILPRHDANDQLIGYMSIEREISDRIRLQSELQVIRAAVEQSANAIVITDPTGTIVFVNPAFEHTTGYSSEEAIGQNPRILKSGKQGPAFYQDLWKTITSGKIWHGIFHNRRKDGTLCWEATTISPVFDAKGHIHRYIAVKENISERVRAEEALRASEALLARTGQVAGVGGWTLDLAEMFPRWTAQTYVIHELDPNQKPSLNEAIQFYAPESRPVIRNAVEEAIAHGTAWDVEVGLVTARGRFIWVRVQGEAEQENGRTVRLTGTIQDITARHEAEESFRQEHQRLENVIEGTNLGTWERNVQTGDQVLNERTAGILGWSLADLASTNAATWRNFIHPDDLARREAALEAHFQGETPFYSCEYRMRHRENRWVWVQSRGRLMSRTPDGLPLMMYGTHTDITEEKEREAALRETNRMLAEVSQRAEAANRAKSDFLANMSHEIRTPLNAIIGMSELLEHDPTGPHAGECLEAIRSSGDALLALISDILDFSKIEAGQLELESLPLNLHHCLADCLHIVSGAAKEKGLALHHEVSAGVPATIIGDFLRLRQVLVNLLTNAVKFTARGEIYLTLEREPSTTGEEWLHVTVRDTGIGIPTAQREKLFHSFSQVDSSTTRRYGGTGLGLAISQRLVRKMGGVIWVDSVEGSGSAFQFRIPLQRAPVDASRLGKSKSDLLLSAPLPRFSAGSAQPLGERCPLRILVAEDNPTNQRLVCLMLKRLGYFADFVVNGLEVLAAVERKAFDLILMDVQMPEMGGLEAAARIFEKFPPTRRPHIVAITANALMEDRDACLNAGMDDYLTKPIRHDQLAATLEAVHAGRSA